jgi:hypothetical protein
LSDSSTTTTKIYSRVMHDEHDTSNDGEEEERRKVIHVHKELAEFLWLQNDQ